MTRKLVFEGMKLIVDNPVENGTTTAVSTSGNIYELHYEDGEPVRAEVLESLATEWDFEAGKIIKEAFDKVADRWVENDKVFVSYYQNVNDLLTDGMDEETLDENYYIWGMDGKPSHLGEPFVIVEVSGATDTPIFTAEYAERLIGYLEDNYSEYLEED